MFTPMISIVSSQCLTSSHSTSSDHRSSRQTRRPVAPSPRDLRASMSSSRTPGSRSACRSHSSRPHRGSPLSSS
eukprot:2655563-Heterocapsa_arctica.AAC.1